MDKNSRRTILGLVSSAGVPGQGLPGYSSLDRSQSFQFVGRHSWGIGTEANLAGSTLKEANTVRVQRLVDGGGAGLSAGKRDIAGGGSSSLLSLTLTEVLDDGCLHGELNEI